MKNTFKKEEKLKSRKLIEQLFLEGKRITTFPILLVYLETEHLSKYKIQASFSVPKRRFKRAVDRNRIKRLMRESYRLQKHLVQELQEEKGENKAVFMFVYIGKEEMNYTTIETSIGKLLTTFKAL